MSTRATRQRPSTTNRHQPQRQSPTHARTHQSPSPNSASCRTSPRRTCRCKREPGWGRWRTLRARRPATASQNAHVAISALEPIDYFLLFFVYHHKERTDLVGNQLGLDSKLDETPIATKSPPSPLYPSWMTPKKHQHNHETRDTRHETRARQET